MNRELKFRVWNRSSRNWLNEDAGTHVCSDYAINIFTGELIEYTTAIDDGAYYSKQPEPSFFFDKTKPVKESPYIIQRYTGLKDRNGKDIYEGDMFEGSFYQWEAVRFNNGRFEVHLHEYGRVFSLYTLCCDPDCMPPAVIGNICENEYPETYF